MELDRPADRASAENVEPDGAQTVAQQPVFSPCRVQYQGDKFAQTGEVDRVGRRRLTPSECLEDEGMLIRSPHRPRTGAAREGSSKR